MLHSGRPLDQSEYLRAFFAMIDGETTLADVAETAKQAATGEPNPAKKRSRVKSNVQDPRLVDKELSRLLGTKGKAGTRGLFGSPTSGPTANSSRQIAAMDPVANTVTEISLSANPAEREELARAFDAYVATVREWGETHKKMLTEGAPKERLWDTRVEYAKRAEAILDEIDSLGVDRPLMRGLTEAFFPASGSDANHELAFEQMAAFLGHMSARLRNEA